MITSLLKALPLVALGWLGTLSLVMLVTDEAPGAVVLFPADGFVSALPEGLGIAGAGPFWIAVRGEVPGMGRALYAAGGRLVLPAGLPGCLPLPGGA
ncbi:hypothetical protein [Litorisediminicola beolgyonensis]|uniref:Uncharacterized protein n=1 Tax=Litorisediminicola beolgyonensis TaxID=1173614 RepID=A0ABW3ZL69_9RHOB